MRETNENKCKEGQTDENGNQAKTKQQKMMTIQHKDTYNWIQYKCTTKTQNGLREA